MAMQPVSPSPRPLIVVLAGPTAVGKTAFAIALAQHFSAPILSADSRQFYKELAIGSAPPSALELEAAEHHFVLDRSIHQPLTAASFVQKALAKIEGLASKQPIILVVGGSGLYLKALMQGLDDIPSPTEEIRRQVAEMIASQGLQAATSLLAELDPATALKIDSHNPRRVARALEVCLHTGQPYSTFLMAEDMLRPAYRWLPMLLTMPRPALYGRIDQRVEAMMAAGLQAEAEALYPHKDLPVLQTVGYREFFAHQDGTYTLLQAIEKVKQNTRNYAKRQTTWFAGQSYWQPLLASDLLGAIALVEAAQK